MILHFQNLSRHEMLKPVLLWLGTDNRNCQLSGLQGRERHPLLLQPLDDVSADLKFGGVMASRVWELAPKLRPVIKECNSHVVRGCPESAKKRV